MKTITKLFATVFAAIALAAAPACTNLDEHIYSSLSPDNLSGTDDEVQDMLGNLYVQLRFMYWSWEGYFDINEESSDLIMTPYDHDPVPHLRRLGRPVHQPSPERPVRGYSAPLAGMELLLQRHHEGQSAPGDRIHHGEQAGLCRNPRHPRPLLFRPLRPVAQHSAGNQLCQHPGARLPAGAERARARLGFPNTPPACWRPRCS